MKEKIVLKGRAINPGIAEGSALVSKSAFGFTHGLDPKTGQIEDKRHEWLGQNVKGKVLVFPFGKSSTSGGHFIREAIKNGNAPEAVVMIETDPVIAAGFMISSLLYKRDVPIVDQTDKNPVEVIHTGDWVRVNGNKGIVEVGNPGRKKQAKRKAKNP